MPGVRHAYDIWERYGTNHDIHGRTLEARTPRAVPNLTTAEAELYDQLVSPNWSRHRRVQQERIPISVAAQELLASARL